MPASSARLPIGNRSGTIVDGSITRAAGAARAAFPQWSAIPANQRGRMLYRLAESLERRRPQLLADLAEAGPVGAPGSADPAGAAGQTEFERPDATIDTMIDRWVWYAGWADKTAQMYGSIDTIAGSHISHSLPTPHGVIGIVAPQRWPLLGLTSVIAPAIATGNVAVAVVAELYPLVAATLAETFTVSGFPAGTVNLVHGKASDLAGQLAASGTIDALDLTGVEDLDLAMALEFSAIATGKPVFNAPDGHTTQENVDWFSDPGTERMSVVLTRKTMWYPRGF